MCYLQASILLLVLGCVYCGPSCPEGRDLVDLVKGQTVFDLQFAISKDKDGNPKNPNKALKGKRGVMIRNGDFLSIDANNKAFTVKKLCVKTVKATEVEFRFFGDKLALVSQETVDVETSRTKTCVKAPSSDLMAIWIIFRNRMEAGSYELKVKDLFMRACIEQ